MSIINVNISKVPKRDTITLISIVGLALAYILIIAINNMAAVKFSK